MILSERVQHVLDELERVAQSDPDDYAAILPLAVAFAKLCRVRSELESLESTLRELVEIAENALDAIERGERPPPERAHAFELELLSEVAELGGAVLVIAHEQEPPHGTGAGAN